MHPPNLGLPPPNLDLPISRWPSLILCSFNCCIWGDILSFCCLCVCSVHPKTTVVVSVHLNVRYVESVLHHPIFLHRVHHFYSPPSRNTCSTKLKAETTLSVSFFFGLFHYHPGKVQVCSFLPLSFLPSPFYLSILSLSSLSRSCKLQIRNIPPHMQWEVSANGLLTASRVAHYQDSQPGSCSGVWSHLPLPSFGFFLLLWGA